MQSSMNSEPDAGQSTGLGPENPCPLLALPSEIRMLIYDHLGFRARRRVHVIVDVADLEITNFIRQVSCREHKEDPFINDCFSGLHTQIGEESSSDNDIDYVPYPTHDGFDSHRKYNYVPNESLPPVEVFSVCKLMYSEARPLFIAATEYYIPTWAMSEAFLQRSDRQVQQNLCNLHLHFGHLDETFHGLPRNLSLPQLRRLRVDLFIGTLRKCCDSEKQRDEVLARLADTFCVLRSPKLETFTITNIGAYTSYGLVSSKFTESFGRSRIDWLLPGPHAQRAIWREMLTKLETSSKISMRLQA